MPNFTAERRFQRAGLTLVAGLDEAGRGAWAGPLVAGAVILPLPTRALRMHLQQVDDSKRLGARRREECAAVIRRCAISVGAGVVSSAVVDRLGLTAATQQAMRRALDALGVRPDALLIDAYALQGCALPQRALVRGDSYSFSIAAASIIAKVERDAMMRALHRRYPQYGFESNKGYGTRAHRTALERFAAVPVHRFSFAPVAARVQPARTRTSSASRNETL